MPDYLADRDWKAELKRYKVDKDGGLGDALATFAKCRGKDAEAQVDALGAIVTKTAAAQKALKDQKELLKYVGQVAVQAKDEIKRVEAAAEEEEGEEGDAVDKVLYTALKRAKTARMFFAMVARGATDGKLILTKAKVKPTDIGDAKKEVGGGRVFRGVCYGEDGRLVFELKKEPPATLEKLIKKTAKMQAGLMIKPICRVGAMDEDLGEEPDDELETPPAPPPAGESPKYAEEQVRKRLAALAGDLKRALSEKLGDTAAIQRLSDQLREAVGKRDFSETLTQLAIVEELVREALAGGQPGETKTSDAASEYAKLVEALTPDFRQAVEQKGPYVKDLKLMFSEALTLGRGKKFEAALPKLRDAETLLRKALEEESGESEGEEGSEAEYAQRQAQVQKLFDAVLPRVENGDADRAETLRNLQSTVEDAASEGKYATALAKLDELEAALRAAERAASVREEIAQATGGGNVQFKALRARWANSQSAAQQALGRFVQRMLSHPEVTTDPRYDEIAAALGKLEGQMPKFGDKLEDLLKEADEAPTAADKLAVRQQAVAVVADYESQLERSAVIKQLDDTMFGKFSIYGEMSNSLRQMKSALMARG